MKYKETGFRALYKNFAVYMLTDSLKKAIKGFPDADKADCILTYGYIDHEAGLTMEILAAGKKVDDKFTFFDPCSEVRSSIRIGAVENDDFALIDDKNGTLSEKYSEILDMLKAFDVSEAIEETRSMAFLDNSRSNEYIDDVLVYLTKEGLNPEGCWMRIVGLGEHSIMGELLNEPYQDFGCHVGEKIGFYVQETKDQGVICYTDMTPSRKLTAGDLEDGSLLKDAVIQFNNERTEQYLVEIMELLRDSYVWIPCNAVMSKTDMEMIEKSLKEAGNDPSALIGKTFSNQDNIRMIPDILQNGDHFFFPVFSSVEEMGKYGENFSKIQKHFLEAIPMARNNEKNVSGIVLNAFTEPFVLDAELFDIVENMNSRLE